MSDTSKAKVSFVVQNLEYKFKGGKLGLRDINFSEESGKLIGIMGGSGAGKSTLLNVLNYLSELNKFIKVVKDNLRWARS